MQIFFSYKIFLQNLVNSLTTNEVEIHKKTKPQDHSAIVLQDLFANSEK